MKEELDPFIYVMANEKMICLLSLMDQTLEFMIDYGVDADDAVKKELKQRIDNFNKWID